LPDLGSGFAAISGGTSRPVWYSEHGLLLMRWLLIALFVSLAALLIAATGSAIHIVVQRARLRSKPVVPPKPGARTG
jgi:hypothetical protein